MSSYVINANNLSQYNVQMHMIKEKNNIVYSLLDKERKIEKEKPKQSLIK